MTVLANITGELRGSMAIAHVDDAPAATAFHVPASLVGTATLAPVPSRVAPKHHML